MDLNHIENQLHHTLFKHREEGIMHINFNKVTEILYAIKNGDKKTIYQNLESFNNNINRMKSSNLLQNMRYHYVAVITLITYFCIENGLPSEEAHILCDLYIQQLDHTTTVEQILQLREKMLLDYVDIMQKTKYNLDITPPIQLVIDHIYEHLHEKIQLCQLAETVGMDRSRLCRRFKKETGVTIGTFITQRKIDAASQMLEFSNQSITNISHAFGFSSTSHFINTFKKETGMTPAAFRSKSNRHLFSNS